MASSKKHNRDFWNGINIISSFLGGIISSVLSNHAFNFSLGTAGFFLFAIAALLYFTGQFIINRVLDNGSNKINPGSLSQKQRNTILRTLESYISKRLKDSLYTSEPIELTIRKDLEKVGRNQHRREAPESFGTRQLLRFLEDSDINRRMLILGEPGAGKTTTLLALAGELIEKAKETSTDPIPVFLELSRLKDNSFKEWLRAEISHETGLDVEFETLRFGEFIPLLDGLDELSPGNQIKAIEEINKFLFESPSLPLIICCRSKVYKSYDREKILDCLKGAVIIQPMSDTQIQTYLNSSINSDAWDEIQKIVDLQKFLKPSETHKGDVLESLFRQVDKDIENFLRTPLFLDLIPAIWDKSFRIQSQEELIEAYVNQFLSVGAVSSGRREKSKKKSIWGREKIPPKEKAQIYLSFLATNMRVNKTIEFSLRDISPRWLEVPYVFDIYNYGSFFGAFFLSISTLYLFCLGRLLPMEWNFIGITISTILSLLFALVFQDPSRGYLGKKIIFFGWEDIEKIKLSSGNLVKITRIFIFISLHLVPIYLVVFLYFTYSESLEEYINHLPTHYQLASHFVIIFLLSFFLGFPVQLLRAVSRWSGSKRGKVRLRKGSWIQLQTHIGKLLGLVFISSLYGFIFSLVLLVSIFVLRYFLPLFLGLLIMLFFIPILIILWLLNLELPPMDLGNEPLPIDLGNIDLTSYYPVFFQAKGLIVLVLTIGCIAISVFVWMQLINGFVERVQEDKYGRNFYFFYENQDEEWINSNPLSFIWESVFCFLAVAILFSILLLMGFLIGGLLLNLYISEGNANLDWAFIKWFVWRLGLPIGLPTGFFIGFWLALFPVVRYFSLWFVLAKFNLIPFRYIKFLDYAVERKILQKIDGRYRFIHQLFLEYFADRASTKEI